MSDWTDLTGAFGYGTQLTSPQMQQLRENVSYNKDFKSHFWSDPTGAVIDEWTYYYRIYPSGTVNINSMGLAGQAPTVFIGDSVKSLNVGLTARVSSGKTSSILLASWTESSSLGVVTSIDNSANSFFVMSLDVTSYSNEYIELNLWGQCDAEYTDMNTGYTVGILYE